MPSPAVALPAVALDDEVELAAVVVVGREDRDVQVAVGGSRKVVEVDVEAVLVVGGD